MSFIKKPSITILIATLIISCSKKEQKVTDINNTVEVPEFKIDYEKFTLDNGLQVILHEDHSDPIVAVATMMHVGSNREKPGKTGFAHFFEHMSFNDSENTPVGANRKLIPEWGGARNGGTSSDYTIYYEVVPKDAFEKVLWIDSDRFGYMINTVTKEALEREKQVVKNEKRQNVDNRPYGYTNEIIRKNLYPENHPYSWTTIGQLPDLQAATLEDVKEFYKKYYGANNATLVIAGDINIGETKKLVKKWFGEIRTGPDVVPLDPMPVVLQQKKSLFFEDNFAKLPELKMVFPTVEKYHKDMYALQILGRILSGSKKSPLFKILVEEKKLTSCPYAYQNSYELAGEFTISIRANSGKDLDSVKVAIENGLTRFENIGFTDNELKRIKAKLETGLYRNFSTVLRKARQLAQHNEFKGDPGYLSEMAKLTNAVTKEDIIRVYNTYIKDKNYVMTSIVPKGQLHLAITEATKAEVWQEEVKKGIATEEVSQGEEAIYKKTPSTNDRSEPNFSELPLVKSPPVWTSDTTNGIKIYGIENNELPLVHFDITIPGGHSMDPIDKSGVSNLMTQLMMEGTITKTPEELEEAIGLLGASIGFYTTDEEIRITASCLSKNFTETLTLVEEILVQPRWDKKEFDRIKQVLKTDIKNREANPRSIASINFSKLIYGDQHILGTPSSGTLSTIENISLEDVITQYKKLAPHNTSFHIVGNVKKEVVDNAISSLSLNWNAKGETVPELDIIKKNQRNQLYFIDVPGAKQSVIYIGNIALSGTNEDFNNLDYANEILGGGSSGKLFQTLRIQKGYTYGAYSGIKASRNKSPFIISTSVRANATLPSLKIIENLITNYENDFDHEDVKITKNKILKAKTRAYEGLEDKLNILREMSKFNKPASFMEDDQKELVSMTEKDYKSIISKYLQEDDMIYLVVGDKATQLEEVKKLNRTVTEIDIHGNKMR